MRKLRYILMLAFMFITLASFTNGDSPQDIEIVKDSTVVQINFENPRILIDDYRDFQSWSELMQSNASMDSTLNGSMNTLSIAIAEYIMSQERRYESAMDYLSWRTDKSIDDIYNAYDKRRKTKIFIIILGIFLVFLSCVVIMNNKNKKGGWQAQLALLAVLLLLSSTVTFGLNQLLLFTFNSDYSYIHEILTLSG